MKKLLSTLSFVVVFTLGLQAQYYFNAINPAGQNPGGLNTDPEQPFGAAGVTAANGYTSIIANGTTALTWSPVQTIPFPFSFNGNPVTSFKVSNTGVLTFTTSATTVPPTANTTLPSTSIPDNSVMVWGLQQGAGGSTNDGVIMKTHGTAPNRQLWINFASFGAPGASGSQWTYWGIVLEETTNKLYVCDLRTFNTPLTLTIGVQINSTTAVTVGTGATAAPNTPSFVTNGGNASSPADNVYYEFIQGTPPADNAQLSSLSLNPVESNSSPISISGTVTNKGTAVLNSLEVSWTADGGATINRDTLTGLSLASNASTSFSHGVTWTPTAGSTYTVEVRTDNPNGVADQDPLDDSLSTDVFVNLGNTVQKKAVFEQFTTAVCQFCPDGAWVAQEMESNYANVYTTSVHSCFGVDAMTNTEASQLCATLGFNSAPTGMVDRTLFDGETDVAFGRGSGFPNWQASTWATRALANSQAGSAVDLNVTGAYTSGTRSLSVSVDASLVDYIEPGTYTVGVMIIEDSVRGTTCVTGGQNNYCQSNAYNGAAGHPFAGLGNPITNYVHKRVMRDILPGTWGAGNVIPANYALNTSYSNTFNATLPTAWDENQIYVIAFVAYFGGSNIANYRILNAERVKMNNLVTGIEAIEKDEASLKVFPNPTANLTNLSFNLSESKQVSIEVFDITGKRLIQEEMGQMVQGNQFIELDVANLPEGFYFLNLRLNDEVITKKISIVR